MAKKIKNNQFYQKIKILKKIKKKIKSKKKKKILMKA
jgi:hypothetical protein